MADFVPNSGLSGPLNGPTFLAFGGIAAAPEPGTLACMGVSLLALGFAGRGLRRRARWRIGNLFVATSVPLKMGTLGGQHWCVFGRPIHASTDCQFDRLADAAQHFHECIDGELGGFLIHHVGYTRAGDHQNLGGIGLF